MRVGCFGCLLLLVILLVLLVAVLGVVFLSGNILDAPEITVAATPKFSRADGYSAQQKLFDLVRRGSGESTRRGPVILTEQEVNAFLANHLAEADLPFNPMSVRFVGGQIEIHGKTPLRNMIQGQPLVQISRYLPADRLDQPVWVFVKGRIRIDPPGMGGGRLTGRMEISEFALGKQPLGSWLLTAMLGGTANRLLRWPVPAVVEDVTIDEGRLIIRTR